jgi:hypothetical protein
VAPDHGIDAGWRRASREPSLADVFGSIKTRPTGPMWKKLIAFLGPGYLVAVGYMDPGNWATSLAGGSKFGYALLTVALLSNLMAILLQALCARLGIATGRDLAQACRDAFPSRKAAIRLRAKTPLRLNCRPRFDFSRHLPELLNDHHRYACACNRCPDRGDFDLDHAATAQFHCGDLPDLRRPGWPGPLALASRIAGIAGETRVSRLARNPSKWCKAPIFFPLFGSL